MKILFIADEEWEGYWDYFRKEDFAEIDLIVSCGDLKASYLSFLATMTSIPVLYVHGNHDDSYESEPPEGCICIEDDIFEYEGVRLLGLGGCHRYKEGKNQYTEKQMQRRIRRVTRQIRRAGGVDLVLTHAPAAGLGDDTDLAHRGFEAFLPLLDRWHPAVMVHGHVHRSYRPSVPRILQYGETRIINASGKYYLDL